MSSSSVSRKQKLLAERRLRVAEAVKAGKTYREIAEKENIALGTVANDMAAVHQMWEEESVEELAQFKNLQMQRLTSLLAGLWASANAGDTKAVAQVRGLIADMNTLMGLDKVTVDQTVTYVWADPLDSDDEIGIGADELPTGVTDDGD